MTTQVQVAPAPLPSRTVPQIGPRGGHRFRRPRWHPAACAVCVLSLLNLVGAALFAWLVFEVSEDWWVGTVATYAPRLPMLFPALLLGLAGWHWHRWSILPNVLAAGIIAGPVAGFQFSAISSDGGAAMSPGSELRVVSCNVQNFEPDFAAVLAEISRVNPDVVAFQEAREMPPLLEKYFGTWHTVHRGEYWIGSRYPLEQIATCEAAAFDRMTALQVLVRHPRGDFLVTNLHLMTARRGLSELSLGGIISGDAIAGLRQQRRWRAAEAGATRKFLSKSSSDRPHLVVGDFNMPTSSSLYRFYFSDLANAFDEAGWGYGYTSPCRPMRYWLPNSPWVRIDHVLASHHWQVTTCGTGETDGSDHRLVWAGLICR